MKCFTFVGAKDFSPLRIQNVSFLLLILLLTAFPASVSADQVTVPLADPSAQKQSSDLSSNQLDKPATPVLAEGQLYDIREP
ncbi:MAG: hypothetical protein D3924_10430, partial [Candidatus Electrothrix sp. AR4]|nr:hypothetical protein [Candidatus Electrothrix sp. AR4]